MLETQTENQMFVTTKQTFNGFLQKAIQVSSEIRDIVSYQVAITLLKEIKTSRKWWAEWNKPIKKKIDDLKKEAVFMERQVDNPMEEAETKYLKPALLEYESKEAELRRQQEKRIEKKTHKPVVLENKTVATGISYSEIWKFKVTDERLIPRQYLVPDLRAIGGVARSLKDKTKIPGIEVYSERIVRAG